MRGGLLMLGVMVGFALPAAASAAPVTGDFDGDGKADLAVDIVGQSVNGHPGAGAVQVIYGFHGGLSGRDRIFTQDTPGMKDSAEDFDNFGISLATGDFNGDGRADLAIGVPFEDAGKTLTTGAVQILYGSKHGLRAKGNQLLREGKNGLKGSADEQDEFGWSLTAGDLGRGRQDDLAIGARGERVGGNDFAGAVQVVFGSGGGLTGKHDQRFTQNTLHVAGSPTDGGSWGSSLAAANFGREGHADLAIGARNGEVGGVSGAGLVNVLYGSRRGVRARHSQRFTQDTPGVKGSVASSDGFGASLAAANLGKTRHADLAIGVPGDQVDTANFAGAVNVLFGSRKGLRGKGSQYFTQNNDGNSADDAMANESFGLSVAAANFGNGKRSDLAIGAPSDCPGVDLCVPVAGSVEVLYGARHGLTRKAQFLTQNTPGVEDSEESVDEFGFAVAAGRFRGTKVNDLSVGVISEDVNTTNDNAGAVNVLRGSQGGITANGDQFLTQGSGGLGGTPETNDHFGSALSGPNSGPVFD